jgi:hypothetical protein
MKLCYTVCAKNVKELSESWLFIQSFTMKEVIQRL